MSLGHHKAIGFCLTCVLGCSSVQGDRFAVWTAEEGGYRIAPKCLTDLDEPRTLSGRWGQVRAGGWVETRSDGALQVQLGTELDLQYSFYDGANWPLDTEGLVLLSFWAHLSDARTRLLALGLDDVGLPPVDVAYGAILPDLFAEAFPFENAAYLPGAHLMLIFPEFRADGIPLAANRGVVTHEWGHAVFHEILHGDAYVSPTVYDDEEAALVLASLHEGFADALAGLLYGDPRFLDASLDMPQRHLDEVRMLGDVQTPSEYLESSEFSFLYDPYPLGTVLASWYWEWSRGTADPYEVLALLFRGAEALAEDLRAGKKWSKDFNWRMVEASLEWADEDLRNWGCRLADERFDGVVLTPCST